MTKDELIYELTRTFSETPGDTEVFTNMNPYYEEPRLFDTVEVDTIEGKQGIVLS